MAIQSRYSDDLLTSACRLLALQDSCYGSKPHYTGWLLYSDTLSLICVCCPDAIHAAHVDSTFVHNAPNTVPHSQGGPQCFLLLLT